MRNILGYCLILLFSCLFCQINAQTVHTGGEAQRLVNGSELVRSGRNTVVPSFIKLRQGSEVDFEQFQVWFPKVLKLSQNDDFEFMHMENDKLGETHYTYRQTYQGIPIEGSMYKVHTRNGMIHSVNGEFYLPMSLNISPAISSGDAIRNALDFVGAQKYKWEIQEEEAHLKRELNDPLASYYPSPELVIIPKDGNYASGIFRLAYKMDIYAQQPFSRADVYVDAVTGEVIHTKDKIHTADVIGTAQTKYSGTQSFTTDSFGGGFRLREVGRGNGIRTFDLNNATGYGGAVDFTDANNIWNNVNANQDEVATDAHWGAQVTYDYYWIEQGRNSINGNGFNLLSYVHYGSNYNNAFWDGQRMTYGDGNGSTFTPLTAIDVTGHEITHGLTNFTANLVYSYESGALNESFSDIFGTIIEDYGRPTNSNWKIGEDMTPSGNGIRNMQNPKSHGDPDTYLGTNWKTGSADNGGVHTNSGVQNHWFYILSVGASGSNDNSDTYNVTGIGIDKAGDVAFRNLTVYLTQNSQYSDARFYGIQSAIDLYGPCTAEVIATTDAWYAVGVGPVFTFSVTSDFNGSPGSSCTAPATVSFNNLSSNAGSFYWDFGDGTTSTAISPSHTYTTLGNYTVSLIGYGGPCGNDTTVKTSFISVDTANSCSVTLNPGGGNDTQTACTGTLYDTGGPTGNYTPNTESIITIAPSGAATVSVTFSIFDFETNFDYVYVYDGPTTSSALIGSYTGNTLPNGGAAITSTGGSITVRQSTDPFVEGAGFELTWNCNLPTTPPATDFIGVDLSTCSGAVTFTDLSTNGPLTWNWDFGDGFNSILQNPSHTYQTNGTYTVTLITSNTFGGDTLAKSAYIIVAKPAGPTAAGVSRCGPGNVSIFASGTGGTFDWYDAASGGTLVNTGATFVTPILSNSLNYFVEEITPTSSDFVGPTNNSAVGAGGYHGNASTQYLEFTVSTNIIFVSAWVNASGNGNRTITLWDDLGNFIRDTTMNISSGNGRIGLDWNISPGAYRLGGTQMDLYRNNAGASYPYSLLGKVEITGSSAGSAFYYYLYDWEIKGLPCRSLRTAVPVTINPLPTAGISPSASQTICPSGNVTFTASGGTGYNWSTGSTATFITVSAAGNYYVVASDINGCSDTSAIVNVTVGTPTASITPSGPTTLCPGDSVILTASSGASYLWSSGHTTQSITVDTSGTFTVQVSDGQGCDANAAPITVIVSATPTAAISQNGSNPLCPGDTLFLTANTGSSYAWSSGDTTQTIAVTAAGSFDVEVFFPGGCSAQSSAVNVTMNSLTPASVTASGPLTFCDGDSVTLTANTGSAYTWSNSATTQSITVKSSGSYYVTVDYANGCSDRSSQNIITVNSVTQATITPSGSTDICDGDFVVLTANTGSGYLWSTSATTQSITVSVTGTYTVEVNYANGCRSNSSGQNVTVTPLPTAAFTFNSTLLQVNFQDASTGGTSWSWNFGDGNGNSLQNPIHTYTIPGMYTVTLIVMENGCSDTTSQIITVIETGIQDPVLEALEILNVYPNPFTEVLEISLFIPEGGMIKMELVDLLGKELISVYEGKANSGEFKLSWNPSAQLAVGSYILQIHFNGRIFNRKLMHK